MAARSGWSASWPPGIGLEDELILTDVGTLWFLAGHLHGHDEIDETLLLRQEEVTALPMHPSCCMTVPIRRSTCTGARTICR